MSTYCLHILLVGCALYAISKAYPTGAPQETCKIFTASHTGHTAQNSQSTYTITASPSTVASGGTITVTLQGNGEPFKGFFIQGQDKNSKKPVGKFLKQSEAQTRDCSGTGSQDAATHVNANNKSKILLQWQAPSDYKGTVVFRSVVVKTYELFWNNVYSSPITVA
ncbi:putative defense protein 3 isoform X2 [Parasteatoda tepidariorum]|nr:putative defense protein 3 isoform X1 [Parasteatoda tepidariorum]XP_015924656.1 putative defense protein 3 isoform X2 [Parasteatoda tepidariorum]